MNLSRLRVSVVAVLLLTTPSVIAQQPGAPDPLDRLGFMIGKWEGTGEGKPGRSVVRREYSRALRSKFIRAVHWSEYPPQERNPKGEVHEDEGFFSFDRARKRFVFRQFHVEGFVNTYVEEPDSTPTRIVFTSEGIENIPAGYRARETYLVHGPDEIEEVFEMAEPGKPFDVYSRTRLKRVK
jgi:THAP4-like, heme-binding beta-barrel domain